MARIDLTESNGWIAEEKDSAVVAEVNRLSAVEAKARRVNMTSEAKAVPRIVGAEPGVVAEGGTYGEASATLDDVVLTAKKFGLIYNVSEEDVQDSFVDVLNSFKLDFAGKFARKYDNACLGVTAAANGTTIPFTSVYRDVSQYNSASNLIQTAGDMTLTDLNNGLGLIEASTYWDDADTLVIAHPTLRKLLREMEDANGALVQTYIDPLGRTRENLFGYDLAWSYGAKTHATATATPTGNPLVIFGSKRLLLNGVRSGPESLVSRDAKFDVDGVLLKCRARRAFAVAKPEAFSVVEVTAAP